jgi:hypothetical protein
MSVWLNINRNGRLGNRLFARAHVYAAARELGATVVDWGLADCARHFPALRAHRLPTYPLTRDGTTPAVPQSVRFSPWAIAALRAARPRRTGRLGPYWSSYWGGRDPDAMRLDGEAFRSFTQTRGLVVLDGYKLRCTDWVRRHAAEIRRYFAPSRAVTARWESLQRSWRDGNRTTVAVHLRASDFRKAQGGRYYLAPEEYARLLRGSPEIDVARTLFVLFSDESFAADSDFVALERAFDGLDHVFMHGDLLDDLVGIGACDRIVGPATSTFSRWAAFAGDRPFAGVARAMLEPDGDALRFRSHLVPWDY